MTTSLLWGGPPALTTVATASIISDASIAIVSAAIILLMVLVVCAVASRNRPHYKNPIFTLMVFIVVATTLALGGLAMVLNINSPTGGPVRWGADYQLWACGNQLDLRGPRGLIGDRVGAPTLYEKNDGHIYYTGTPARLPDDASLGKFMQAVGGNISDNTLVVPLDDTTGFMGTPTAAELIEPFLSTDQNGVTARFISGQRCGDERAEVQTFAYAFNPATNTYSQTKLDHPATYELSHSRSSPPGDCIIVEFAAPKDRTDHLCASYGVRDAERCTQFGVPADKVARCDMREVRP